ncbi:MAG: VOC family protein [Novosphingobium sp.]|nr:VOC family protein [Novosphingobium sp.]MCP5402975.1 VOC family protein [Novosphingobium sp.]
MIARQFVQSCFIVPDIEAAMAEWLRVSNIGPFFVMSHVRPSDGLYRGQPADLEMSCAFAQAGPMQIELIEQHTDGPSVYRDMFPAGTGGFHHLCYWADGTIGEEVEYYRGQGIEAGYLASFGALNFGYFDAREVLGCFVEVLEKEPGTMELFKSIAEAAVDWDGRDPIRYVS